MTTCSTVPATPAGALVLELLPYNWEWKRISEMYYNMTRSLGDIHHFAWRATSPQWAVYNPPEDAKYSHWTIEECSSKSVLMGARWCSGRVGRIGGPQSRSGEGALMGTCAAELRH